MIEFLGDLVPRPPRPDHRDRQLGDVDVAQSLQSRFLAGPAHKAGDTVDLRPGLFRELDHARQELFSLSGHLHPREVERGHENVRGARRLEGLEGGGHTAEIHPAAAGVEDRGLSHPPMILWVDCTHMSAPAVSASRGRSAWNLRCGPWASSTSRVNSRLSRRAATAPRSTA